MQAYPHQTPLGNSVAKQSIVRPFMVLTKHSTSQNMPTCQHANNAQILLITIHFWILTDHTWQFFILNKRRVGTSDHHHSGPWSFTSQQWMLAGGTNLTPEAGRISTFFHCFPMIDRSANV